MYRNLQRLPLIGGMAMLGLTLAGCGADSSEPAARLRVAFPEQAGEVLGTRAMFVDGGRGFSIADGANAIRSLDVEMPKQAESAIRVRLEGGQEMRIRQVGVSGVARMAENAIAYQRAQGTSFWTVASGGIEEWLHLEAGAVSNGGVAAAWEVEGLAPELTGDVVTLSDAEGMPRMRVSAPSAYAAGGRPIAARLSVRGSTIELSVDATNDEVLIDPVWVTAASLSVGRNLHASTKLADGRVIVTGGSGGNANTMNVEIYNPATNSWTTSGTILQTRQQHTASLLPNGTVLIAGGSAAASLRTTVEIYDPATGTSTAGPTITGRTGHTATTLQDGRILLTGGYGTIAPSLETTIYDPTTGTFTVAAPLPREHQAHAAVLLDDGRVLIAGSYSGNNNPSIMVGVDIYTPSANTWAAGASMLAAQHFAASGRLNDGRVIIAGGDGFGAPVSTVEIYNPTTNSWAFAASLSGLRTRPAGMTLNDGTFLVAGGYSGFGNLATSEIYNPTTNAWTAGGSMSVARYLSSAERLNNGDVIVIGGSASFGGSTAVDIYSAGGGSGGGSPNGTSCTSSAQCTSGFCVDGVCCNSACGGGSTSDCQACSVASGGTQNGVCGAVTGGSCAPTCVTFQRGVLGTVTDAGLNAASPTKNYGASQTSSVGSVSGAERQTLVKFDLSSIPSNAIISQATLSLGNFSGTGTVRGHRATASWSESTVTWSSFAGAYAAPVDVTLNLNVSTYSGDATSLVSSWVSGAQANSGFLLERDLSGSTTVYTSEFATSSSRPSLQVCYSLP